MNQSAPTNVVKSAARGLDIFELLAANPEGLTLSQICAALRLPKSSAHALVGTLFERGYLMQGQRETTYRLGPRTFEIGSAYIRAVDLVHDGQDVVRAISRACDETVHLATLDGGSVLYVAKSEGTSTMRMVSAIGQRFPAHGTGVGKMLLSGLSEAELDALYPPERPLESLTPHTIVDPLLLRDELARTRARGYALDHEESTAGLCCVAAPVYDQDSRLVAAISISVPTVRFGKERQQVLLELVQSGARQLSTLLGYSSDSRHYMAGGNG